MSEIIKLETTELMEVEPSKAAQIKQTFEPMVLMLEAFEERYAAVVSENEITDKVTKAAKRLRLDIAKVRTSTEKLRKEQKEQYLRAGKAIDGVSNILKWAITEKEERLKSIEEHFEKLEKERLDKLQVEREELLTPFVNDASERDLSSMDEDVWSAYLTSKKQQYFDRLEAIKKAEEERIKKEKAEEEERARIKKENERLRAEAVERERKAEEERKERERLEAIKQAEREKKEAAEKARIEAERAKERAEYEAKLATERKKQAKLDAERRLAEEEEKKAHEARLAAEQAEREKLAAELKAKEEAEKIAIEEKNRLIQAELNKGDLDKVKDLKKEFASIANKYTFKSEKNQKMFKGVCALIVKVITYIEEY